jgi:hypothetical protein
MRGKSSKDGSCEGSKCQSFKVSKTLEHVPAIPRLAAIEEQAFFAHLVVKDLGPTLRTQFSGLVPAQNEAPIGPESVEAKPHLWLH